MARRERANDTENENVGEVLQRAYTVRAKGHTQCAPTGKVYHPVYISDNAGDHDSPAIESCEGDAIPNTTLTPIQVCQRQCAPAPSLRITAARTVP